jgi:large subunit ribosomal protein L22
MAFKSSHRGARISPTKVRPVLNMIRDKHVGEAATILRMSKKRGAKMILAVLDAAVANADQAEADARRLFVSRATIDSGPTIKRFQPKDRGRAHPILKRTSHIVVEVDQYE